MVHARVHNEKMIPLLHEAFRPMVVGLIDRLEVRLGVFIWIASAARSIADQFELFQQGRVYLVTGKWIVSDPKKIVTQAQGDNSPHTRGGAVDLVPWLSGKLLWDRDDLFAEMAAEARSMGIVCGRDFTHRDDDHFEHPAWRTWPVLKNSALEAT